MASPEQLGIYWGDNSFSVVETVNGQISNILQIPFDATFDQEDIEENIPDELKFPTILKKTLEFRSIKTKIAHLSLPSNELIFRSFIIPYMEKKDIKNVVEFEITKYIPIKLNELVYTYHTAPFLEDKQKKLRVLFLAIRQEKLAEMTQAIQQAGLTLKNIEPAPVSLINLLQKNKLFTKKESTAIIQLGEDGGEIFVAKEGTLTFMRKLNIAIGHDDLATLQTTLLNETRISFNFYNRQNPNEEIHKIIIISQYQIPNLAETLAADFDVPTIFSPIEDFIPIDDNQSILYLNALGTMQRKQKFSSKYFDLSESAIELQRSGKDPLAEVKKYSIAATTLAVCVLIILGSMFIGSKLEKKNLQNITDLKNKLGKYEVLKIEDIRKQKEALFTELNNYIKTPLGSGISVVLLELPKLLPKGAWLDSFKIADMTKPGTDNTNLKITLSGKIFSDDLNEQFYLVNEFIENLKQSEILNNFYTDVTRDSAARVVENNYTITNFTITCK